MYQYGSDQDGIMYHDIMMVMVYGKKCEETKMFNTNNDQ
jgi:hypothetical protein